MRVIMNDRQSSQDVAAKEGRSRTPVAALRHREFSIYWGGSVLSLVGSQFTTVAMAWQIYELTNSPLELGLLGLVRGAPMLILLLFGGLLADALNRRHLMMATQIGQMCVSAALSMMTFAGSVTPGVLYTASLFLALFSALEQPARTAIIPNLVPRNDLANALALSATQRHLATIIGPSLAGILLARSGATFCYAVDAASWIAMLAALMIMRPLAQSAGGRRALSMKALGEGVEFVWTHPVILSMMALDFGQNFFGSGRALLPIYARDILNVGPEGLGLLYAATSAGALAMGTVMSIRSQTRRAGTWVLVSVSTYGFHGVIRRLSILLVVVSDACRSGRGEHGKLRSPKHDQSAAYARRDSRPSHEREQHVYQYRAATRSIRGGRRGLCHRRSRRDCNGRIARNLHCGWTCDGSIGAEVRSPRNRIYKNARSPSACLSSQRHPSAKLFLEPEWKHILS